MNDLLLLVDLENTQRFDLGQAPPNARIKIFVGQLQSKLPTKLVQQAQALGSRLEWMRIDDPCRGSDGMFVQSEKLIEAYAEKLGDISIYSQGVQPHHVAAG